MDNSPAGVWHPRFDWYAATVDAKPSQLLEAFEGLTPGASFEDMERVPHGYGRGWRLVDADGAIGMVWGGGNHERPHVVVTGDSAPAGAALLRECFPAHAVARCDVIGVQTADPGAYDALQAEGIEVARRHRLKVGTAGDHLLTFEGRTLYLGAPSSPVRGRLYDKAAELRSKLSGNPERLATVPDHLARFELQIRPAGAEAKQRCACADPAALLGAAAWSREYLANVAALEVAPFPVRPAWRQSDDEAAYWHMLRQWGPLLARQRDEVGSWDLVGRNIGLDLAKLAKEERQ